ncbi:MAG TPA: lysophospholipid acyltransferase family protein [Thermomicrobiales bacterium]|nr:lysophospholipid acyltransferase family protein [Thermomicrobiales bacterium]
MGTLRLLKFGLWLVRWVPSPLVRLLPPIFALIAYLAYPERRQAIAANQRQVLGAMSPPRRQWQVFRVMVNSVRNYHVLARLYSMSDDDIRNFVDLHGLEHLEAARVQGRGVIVIGAHITGFNALAPFAALYAPPAGAFVEPLEPPALFDFVSQIRGRTGLQLLLANRQGTVSALRLLRQNGILLIVGDRYLGANGSVVEFFGKPTTLPHGPIVLALRDGSPILPATFRQVSFNRLQVTLRPPLILQDTGRLQEDIAANMPLLAHALEETIRAAPAQWIVLDPVWPCDRAQPPHLVRPRAIRRRLTSAASLLVLAVTRPWRRTRRG